MEVVDRILKKVESAGEYLPAPEVHGSGAPYGLISIGGQGEGGWFAVRLWGLGRCLVGWSYNFV